MQPVKINNNGKVSFTSQVALDKLGRPLLIWGAGSGGRNALTFLRKKDENVGQPELVW